MATQDPLDPLSVGPQTPVRAETSGEYETFDIGRNQSIRETLQLLSHNLEIKKKYLFDADNCYHGDTSHRSFNSEQFRATFIHLRHFSDNWLKMIVDAYVAREIIQGFNCGDEATSDMAWALYRANNLDKFAQLAFRETAKFGECYLLVDPTVQVKDKDGDNDNFPRITVETPYQMIGWQDPNDRSKNVCAMKYWQSSDGFVYANLFTSSKVLKFQSPQSYFRWQESGYAENIPIPQSIPWQQYDEYDHGLGVCPVFTIEHSPTLTRGGVSMLEELIPLQKAIDVEIKNMLLTSEYAAFPQKYALNVAIDRNADGTPVLNTQMESSISRFWGFPPPEKPTSPEVKVGQFQAADISQYTTAIEELIENMAHISSIPAYRLMGKLANMPLALDTVVPTPTGRTTMGAIEVGDTIYAPDGSEQNVVEVFPIKRNQDCYRLTFDDGTEIVADAQHCWETTHFADPEKPYDRTLAGHGLPGAVRETSVVSTERIAETLLTSRGTHNHFIPVAGAPEKPERRFSIDPYALGVYLGDGSRWSGHVTAHVSDAHIPEQYFHGSKEQRLALLQGLMDTDGTVKCGQGSVSFTAANKRLIDDVRRLAQSLGHKLAVRESVQSPRSKGAGNHIWRMTWMPPQIVFRMKRKAELQQLPKEGGDGRSSAPFRRYIVACTKVASVPVRCINVSHPSHLFCVTDAFVATHNSASAIIAAEAGFIDSVRVNCVDYSLGIESAMALGLEIAGHPVKNIETLWKDPSAVSGPNLAASLVALDSIGVPKEVLFGMMGNGPQVVEEWMKLAKAEEKANNAREKVNKAQVLENSLNQLTQNTAANGNSSQDQEQPTNIGRAVSENDDGSGNSSSD